MNYTFANFIVGPSNHMAHTAAMAVAKAAGTVYNPLVIYGGAGLGKTHLLQAIQTYIQQHTPTRRTLYVPAVRLRRELAQGKLLSLDILLIDDLQFLVGREHGQEIFLRAFHMLYEAEKQIIVSMDRSPQVLAPVDIRLCSRLASGLTADIQPPGLATRLAILHTKAYESGISLSQGVAALLAASIQNNVRELENCLARLIAYASLHACSIDEELAHTVLWHMETESRQPVTVVQIQQAVAKRFGLTVRQLQSGKRHRALAFPRQVAMFLCRHLTRTALPEIGQYFGGRNSSTVSHACGKIAHMQETDEEVAQLLWELRHALRH
jgi:chromosomal replication initiator protein